METEFNGNFNSEHNLFNGVTINGNAIFGTDRAPGDRDRSHTGEQVSWRKCLESLEFEDFWYKERKLQTPTPGTCEWLYETPEYLRWVEEHGLLLVRGNPGSGKSTLLKFAVERQLEAEAEAIPRDLVLRFFFHSSGANLHRSMEGFFRSLLHQLVEQDSGSKKSFYDLYHKRMVGETAKRRMSGDFRWHAAELRAIVETLVLNDKIAGEITIFVDAIDECLDQERAQLISFIRRLRGVGTERSNRPKIFLTCRLYPDESFMMDFNIRLEENNQDDIQRYVESELLITGEDMSDLIEFKNSLSLQTGGLFLWARLAVNRARMMSGQGFSLKYIGLQIFQCPRKLNELYNVLLQGIKDEELLEAGRLFQWVRFACRPLHLEELKIAMTLDLDGTSRSIHELENIKGPDHSMSDHQMKKRILHLGKGLIGITDSNLSHGRALVGFHHETVKDYIDTAGLQYLDSRLSREQGLAKTADLHIANTCISYLSSENLHSASEWGSKAGLRSKFFLYDYATSHWLDHAIQAELKEIGNFVKWPSSKALAAWVKLSRILKNRVKNGREEGTTLLHLAADHGLLSLAERIMPSPSKIPTQLRMLRSPVTEPMAQGIVYLWSLIVFLFISASRGAPSSTVGSSTVGKSDDLTAEIKPVTTAPGQSSQWPRINWSYNGSGVQREIVNARDARGRSALYRAAANGRLEMLRFLYSLGAELSLADRAGWTPIFAASRKGHFEVVKFLHSQGADLNIPNNEGWTPIFAASLNGNLEMVQFLHAQGADLKISDTEGWTPIFAASFNEHLEMVQFLHAQGGDLNIPNNEDWTPILNASKKGRLEVVKFLHAHGANIHMPGNNGCTPISIASRKGHLEIVKFLCTHGANVHTPNTDDWTPIFAASNRGHLDVVKLLLDNGAGVDVHTIDNKHCTPLHAASGKGYLDIVKLLYTYGSDIDINIPDDIGRTPVHTAAYAGHVEMVKFLCEKGANIRTFDHQHKTPLYSAAHWGHLEIVKYLYGHGADADIHTPTDIGRTPVYTACETGRIGIVKFLYEKGANLRTFDNQRKTPLYVAAHWGHLEIVKFLHSHEADTDIHTPTDIGRTPVYTACVTGNIEMVKFLHEKGANIRTFDHQHKTPLYVAAHRGYLDVIKFLHSHGADADIHTPTDIGRTPVYTACDTGHIEVVKFLYEKGANLHTFDQRHKTPLYVAAHGGHIEVVKYLCAHGADADIHTPTSDGITPVSAASRRGHVEIVDFLQSLGHDSHP
ncbi:unnamed protein product [Penicillium salamii]|uniref:Nephrocystin 3-like N-terminal domain-containing protein n=1 Tax=Penicillium salamii TaxID=1612424 RepID=A0A9W4IXA9_9EURO|nr:unnamed protein product [Penicillium salamii]